MENDRSRLIEDDGSRLGNVTASAPLASDNEIYPRLETMPTVVQPTNFTMEATANINEQIRESDSETCVTVFGIPPNSLFVVLTPFLDLGKVMKCEVPNFKVNWVHLKYASKSDAARALAENGTIFSGEIKVGVIPCNELDVLDRLNGRAPNLKGSMVLNESDCCGDDDDPAMPQLQPDTLNVSARNESKSRMRRRTASDDTMNLPFTNQSSESQGGLFRRLCNFFLGR